MLQARAVRQSKLGRRRERRGGAVGGRAEEGVAGRAVKVAGALRVG